MATFADIRTLHPTAAPAGTDLMVAEKADGSPASYTLDEIAAYVQGVSLPIWATDTASGCHLKFTSAAETTTQPEGIVFFNNAFRDTGFYAVPGSVVIPVGVTRIQVVAQLRTQLPDAIVSVLKNGATATPEARVHGSGYVTQVIAPDIVVVEGDLIQIHCSDVTAVYKDISYFNVRVLEKVA